MSFDAGAITGKLTLDLSDYAHGMIEATQIAQLFPSVVRSFLAEPLLGLIDLAKEAGEAVKEAFLGAAEGAHQLDIESQKAGVPAEFLEQVAAAASSAGVQVEEVAHAMAFLGRNAADAAAGNATMAKSFADLGIAFADAEGHVRPIEALFDEVANAIARLPTAGEQARAAMDLMSRGGIGMLPVLKKGAEGVNALGQEMLSFRGKSSASLIESAEQWHHLEAFASQAWAGIKAAVAEPILDYVSKHFDELKEGIRAWATSAKQFVTDAVIPAMQTLGNVLKFVTEHWQGISTAVGVFVGYKTVVAVIESMVAAYNALTASLLSATSAQTALNAAQRGLAGAGIGAGLGGLTTGSLGGTIGGGIGGLLGNVLGNLVVPGIGGLVGAGLLGYVGGQLGNAIGNAGGAAPQQVNVTVNQNDSTLQIAEALRREFNAAIRQGKSELQAQVHAARVQQGLDAPWAGSGD